MKISTDFPGGGGNVIRIDNEHSTIRFKPQNEGIGGWSQVWWFFKLSDIEPGQVITLQLDRDNPRSAGISPQIFFSYDKVNWGLTDEGHEAQEDNSDLFIYKHKVRSDRVWFAYDLPYTSEQVEAELIQATKSDESIDVFELCKTRKGRGVTAFKFNSPENSELKYGIWLQARAHSFEAGSSWVIHELGLWLMSKSPEAIKLRNCANIMLIPIVDVDAVEEGRTGKYQKPFDHWMNWGDEPSYWPEIKAIKTAINDINNHSAVDLFIDFHGPGGLTHPYFILPNLPDLPYPKQKENTQNFFQVLQAFPLDEKARKSQSMHRFHFSERDWKNNEISSSHEWVLSKTTSHTIAMTLEVNMNTPLSTRHGFRVEAHTLGKAMSTYFNQSIHQRT